MLDGFTTHTRTRTHRHQNDMMMIYVIFMTFVEWKPKHQHFVSPNNNNNGRKNSEAKWIEIVCRIVSISYIRFQLIYYSNFQMICEYWLVYMCVWYMFTLVIRWYTSVKRIFTWACDTHDGFFSHWMKIGCHNVNMNYQKLFAFFSLSVFGRLSLCLFSISIGYDRMSKQMMHCSGQILHNEVMIRIDYNFQSNASIFYLTPFVRTHFPLWLWMRKEIP